MSSGPTLYIDALAGVAGDMLLGALIDAGAPLRQVQDGLGGLGIDGLEITVQAAVRHGLTACFVRVLAPPDTVGRDWAAVRALLDRARLPSRARARAHATFRRLAHAEGAVHGISPDEVHFHEVGANDALADVCGVALALEALDVDRVVCSPLPAARGLIAAAHGVLPLPAPATLELLRGAPIYGVEVEAELVTPTGAALVTALADDFGPVPPMLLASVGCGAGARELPDRPNIVRVLLGATGPQAGGRLDGGALEGGALEGGADRLPAVLVECTIDDLSGELVADGVDACMVAGALDVWITPVQMKKGRPGIVLTAVARPQREPAVAQALLRHTTTLGVRVMPLVRWELDRDQQVVSVDGQPIAVKIGRLGGEILNLAPEHDDVARAAAALQRPAKMVWAQAWAAAQRDRDQSGGGTEGRH
ncbi:MAG: nickel pincer cofactor biosynthesis protein LarC [Solirubrobacteraceae bacterium]